MFPGAAAGVARPGERPSFAVAGSTSTKKDRKKIARSTLFDLASLTKIFFTTTVLARWVDRRTVDLDDVIVKRLSSWKWNKAYRDVTVRDLLSHRAGFADWRDFSKMKPGEIGPAIAELLPEYRLRRKSVYSDLGFIVLGEWMRTVSGKTLEELFDREVRDPLMLKAGTFRPLEKGIGPEIIAATEEVPGRGGVLHGEVHDDNANAMGGAAGHAGLFAPIEDCVQVALAWLKCLQGQSGFLSMKTAQTFVQPQEVKEGPPRALGWDLPTQPGSSGGSLISAEAIGHLGFTGTSVWLDLKRKALAVLLTNRIHPTRANERIREFRPRFHDGVWGDLDS